MALEEQRAVKAAHEALAAVPGYSGACVVLYKDGFSAAQISSTVPREYERDAIARLNAYLNPPALIVSGRGG